MIYPVQKCELFRGILDLVYSEIVISFDVKINIKNCLLALRMSSRACSREHLRLAIRAFSEGLQEERITRTPPLRIERRTRRASRRSEGT